MRAKLGGLDAKVVKRTEIARVGILRVGEMGAELPAVTSFAMVFVSVILFDGIIMIGNKGFW